MNFFAALIFRIVLSVWYVWVEKKREMLFASALVITGSGVILLAAGTRTESQPPSPAEAMALSLPEGGSLIGERLVHTCSTKDTLKEIARVYYPYTQIFVRDDFLARLESENRNAFRRRSVCEEGNQVVIPDPILRPIENRPIGKTEEVRAVYLRGENAVPGRLAAEVKRLKRIGANGIVFDVKDILGVINYRSSIADVEKYRKHPAPIPDLPKMIEYLHRNGIYIIARAAMFQDMNLATLRSDLAIPDRNSPTGKLLFKGMPLWVDPGRPEVQLYNLRIIHEIVEAGVDEVQLDYFRYPAEGDLSGVSFHNVRKPLDKTEHLKHFLAQAWILTRGTGVRLGVDVFGVVAWGEEADRNSTGQRLEVFAPYIDVVSPMLYPSHFDHGFDGIPNPADEPVYFYQTGDRKVRELVGNGVIIRPWLQAFKWRVSNYNERYILKEIEGNRAGGGEGWMMWNAGNDYNLVYRALSGQRPDELVENMPERPREAVGRVN